MSSPIDNQTSALGICVRAFEKLDEEQRRTLLQYLEDRYAFQGIHKRQNEALSYRLDRAKAIVADIESGIEKEKIKLGMDTEGGE